MLFALSGPYPHWLIGVASLHWPVLPLGTEQLLSYALLDYGVCI